MEYKPITIEPSPAPEEAEVKSEREGVPGLPGTTKELPLEERPLSLFGSPLVADLLQIRGLYDDNIDEAKIKASKIDTWIKNELLKREWQPILKSYQKILEEIKEKYNVSDNQSGLTQLNKLYIYLGLPKFSGF